MASTGGTLNPLDSFEITFKATVNFPASGQSVPVIINLARLTASSQSLTNFVDDGVAILNPVSGPLPIMLEYFGVGSSTTNTVKVSWKTSVEINSEKFEVERSSDGVNFISVVVVKAAGNSSSARSYTILDDISMVKSQTIYYRLKQTDVDDKTTYSKIAMLKKSKGNNGITVSPNPFHDYINVSIECPKNEKVALKIFNMLGKEVISKNILLTKGTNSIIIEDLMKLPAGGYLLSTVINNEPLSIWLVK